MYGFFSDPDLHVLSMVVPVGNNGLQAAGVAAAVRDQPGSPIVYCGAGDGTTQEGEFLEACAEAVRSRLPVLFVVQDNHYAISTPTAGRTFYSLPDGANNQFFGMPIRFVDGRQAVQAYHAFGEVVADMRQHRGPALIVLEVERLSSHTNADDHSIYRSADDIARCRQTGDPIPLFEQWLLEQGWSETDLAEVRQQIELAIVQADEEAIFGADPEPEFEAKRPLKVELTHPSRERRGSGDGLQLIMRDAIKEVLGIAFETILACSCWAKTSKTPKATYLA